MKWKSLLVTCYQTHYRFADQMVIDTTVNVFLSRSLSLSYINKLIGTHSWEHFRGWFLMLYGSWACEKSCLFH